MINFLFTKDSNWLQKWDDFLLTEDCGSHLLYSDWLKSYTSYGFNYEVFLVLDNDKIVGGFGAVIAKFLFFKFYIIPHGPILKSSYRNHLQEVVNKIKGRAKELGCCYAQYSLPISDEFQIKSKTFSTSDIKDLKLSGKKGNLFKFVYSSYGINWVDFSNANSSEQLINQFTAQVRRNINLSYKTNAKIHFAKSEEECRLAYKAIEDNALQGNYTVRSFKDFKDTILNLVEKNRAFLIFITIDDQIKGAGFAVNCGNCLTYISGGTQKEKPDLKLGYLIHWEFIKKSFELGFSGYNISMGGSKGVVEFKSKFNTTTAYYKEPHYHIVLKPLIFRVYTILNSIFVKNKKTISVVLKRLK